jgi:histidinol dehydrogenase
MKIRQVEIRTREDIPAALAFLREPVDPDGAIPAEVSRILADVRARGDNALVDQVRRYDWPCPGPAALRVSRESIEQAAIRIDPSIRDAIAGTAASIRKFHEGQRPASTADRIDPGLRAEILTHPLESVGLYVPGGRASYPTTLLMLAIPAQLAGVRRIAVASPAGPDGLPADTVRATAGILGIEEMYAVGGAAAIGALAYGTRAIPKVDKILGPGNAWVAEAKRQVFGAVGIDGLSGPTEIAVLSDGSAPARWIAADLLAQAEHDPLASAILLTADPAEPSRVLVEVERILQESPRAEIQRQSLSRRGALVVCADLDIACDAARFLAPEHLSIMAVEAECWADRVPSAAAVFVGFFTPQAAGDYGAGPSHSLPTAGTARFASPLGVWDFVRYQSRLELDRAALKGLGRWMEPLAEAEGLPGHALSLRVREEP